MADLENKNAKGLKDVRKTLEEKRKQKAALELELAMLEAEPNRKILVSFIENDVKLNEKLIGLKADEVKVIAAHYGGEGDMIEFFDYVKELLGGQS